MMIIEKVHGLQATGMSLNERFTMLSAVAPVAMTVKPRPLRPTVGSFLQQNLNFHNRALIEQIARTLQQQAKKRNLRQRLGLVQPGLRRYGSEGNLTGLQQGSGFRSNNTWNRQPWKQTLGNLNRAASFSNLSGGARRGRKRGMQRHQQWRRGGNYTAGGGPAGAGAGAAGAGGARRGAGRRGVARRTGLAAARMSRLRARLAAGGAAGGAWGAAALPSRGELDAQLERYMAAAPAARRARLDSELDAYRAMQH